MTVVKFDSLLVDRQSDQAGSVHEHSQPIYNEDGQIDRKFIKVAYPEKNKFNSSAHQICLKCSKPIGINSTQLCAGCAKAACYRCGKLYRLNMKSMGSAYCARCRGKNRKKKSEI